MSVDLTYLPPAEIDGEPEDVRDLSLQQLVEAAEQFGRLIELTLVQLRAAGVGREGEDWISGLEAHYCIELSARYSGAIESLKWLQKAEN